MRAQDKVVTQSRRILFRTGVDGDDAWLVPNTDPEGGTQTYPLANTPRSVNIGKFDISPGCTLRAVCLHLPSGQTNYEIGGSGWYPAGVQGIVHLATTWTAHDDTTETRTYVMPLEGSTLEFGAENTSTGGMQKSCRLANVKMNPPVDLNDLAERNKWSRPHSIEIEVRYVGSPRVVDLVVYEIPNFYLPEADDPDDEWTSHIFAIGRPDDNAKKVAYPVDEAEDTSGADADQRHGTLQTLRVAENQRKRLGPMLFHWGAYTESSAGITTTTLPFVTIGTAASTRWCNLLNVDQFETQGSPATFEASEPGWSVSCGGYARSWLHNNPHVMGAADRTAAVGVLFRVYAQNNNAAAQALRLHTAHDDAVASSANNVDAHSWIDLSLSASAALDWYEAYGFLQVGVNPEDHVIAQVLVQQATSGTDLDVCAVEAYVWDGAYAPV